MNCIEAFIDGALRNPEKPALWEKREGTVSFGQIYRSAAQMQTIAKSNRIVQGDCVLIFGKPSASLYAAVIGLLGIGCTPIFIEPWLPLAEIEEIIAARRPKLFVSNLLGRLWGLRIGAIRKIPSWVSFPNKPNESKLEAIPLPEDHPGFMTFTTGTTGGSKGIVRTHGVLRSQAAVLSKYLCLHGSSDLCALPNFVFLNLSMGRCSVLASDQKAFRKIPKELSPNSVSCGPHFLKKLIENKERFPALKSFHIGGALAPCSLYEQGFESWPLAKWTQVYGSTEAEPVAIADAREVVQKCKGRNHFQTLFLGRPIPELQTRIDESGVLWVSGSHVSGWHNMGDRIEADEEGWWYRGRSTQPQSDFLLEQEISSFLKSDEILIANGRYLLAEGIGANREALLKRFPHLLDAIECKIYRDRRHRSRIDRKKTIERAI